MNKKQSTDKIASTLLGKKIEGVDKYTPEFLVAIPREENRKTYNINENNLPFDGWDIWHCYEFSTMTNQNIPVTQVIKLRYPCTSKYIVESKSLKLYLNSFNMSNFGNSEEECLKICKSTIEKDLSEKLQTSVEINFLSDKSTKTEIFGNFEILNDYINEKHIKIDKFKEAPEVLETEEGDTEKEYFISFDSLRSNCRVTHQPDFGDLFIYYNSTKQINYNSLLEYLVSFRCEYHFHEECVEMIYKRMTDILNAGDKLLVCALYTRRGGIDITPVRYSKNLQMKDIDNLINLSTFARYGIKQ